MMSQSGGVCTWQEDEGLGFELHFDGTFVIFVVRDAVFGVVLVMQALSCFSELHYDVR